MDRLSIIHKKSMKLIEKETGGLGTAGKSLMRLEGGGTHDSPNGGGSLKKSVFYDSAVDIPNKNSGNSPGNQSIQDIYTEHVKRDRNSLSPYTNSSNAVLKSQLNKLDDIEKYKQ